MQWLFMKKAESAYLADFGEKAPACNGYSAACDGYLAACNDYLAESAYLADFGEKAGSLQGLPWPDNLFSC